MKYLLLGAKNAKSAIFHDFHQPSPNHKNVTRGRSDIPGTVLESSRCVFHGFQIF